MGLILATSDVGSPDGESQFDVISITLLVNKDSSEKS